MDLTAAFADVLRAPVYIFAFAFVLSIVVFFHEYGHFGMARLLGVRVDAFSIGFGPALARWRDKHGTQWRIGWLPLGGYVKFFGDANAASQPEDDVAEAAAPDDDPQTAEHRGGPMTTQFSAPSAGPDGAAAMTPEERKVCFHFKPVWARALIVGAGPMANFILAVVIFSLLFMTFGRTVVPAKVGTVVEGSAAAEAGIEVGDLITEIDGRRIRDFNDLRLAVQLRAEDALPITLERDGEIITVVATPERAEIEDAYGNTATAGRLGVGSDPSAHAYRRFGPGAAVLEAVDQVGDILRGTVTYLGRIVTGREDASQLGGPLRIAKYSGQAAESGFAGEDVGLFEGMRASLVAMISLAGLLSVSVGFLNLLPVPVLDGGHLMYYAFEAVRGRPLNRRAQAIGFRVGLALLASFMLFVTWNDLNNGLF